jgi:hypothetical protein
MTGNATPARWGAKHLPKALLGHALDTLLCGGTSAITVNVASVWDAWWACYRAALPADRLALQIAAPAHSCASCTRDVLTLAAQSPPGHPGAGATRPCGCLRNWAIRMRAPAPAVTWPPLSLSLALIKPGAPAASIREMLSTGYDPVWSVTRSLSACDTRRLYPEAYGAEYVAARDAYMTSGPVTAMIVRARGPQAVPAGPVKDRIRRQLGTDPVRNHLHMPDNPGEALADIAHFAGWAVLTALYERHERDRAPTRLAFYRAALGIPDPGTHRHAS